MFYVLCVEPSLDIRFDYEPAIFMRDQEEALWRVTASSGVAWQAFLLPCLVSIYWAALCLPVWYIKATIKYSRYVTD